MENKPKSKENFEQLIGDKEKRKLEAKRNPTSVWSGLGLFGMVGWSITVPTILGIASGYWLDKKLDTDFSWTLSLMFGGLILGCVMAWSWVDKEDKNIHKNK